MICCALLAFLFIVSPVENANILFVTTFASVSHQKVFQPIWKELSLRGHNVTVITPNPLKDEALTNLTEVDLGFLYEKIKIIPKLMTRYLLQKPGFVQVFVKDVIVTYMFSKMHADIFDQPGVQQIINGNQKFDVVVAEWLFPTMGAFAAKFNCPLVGVTSLGAPIPSLDTVGNPSHPIFSPDHNLPIGRELSFKDRLMSALYSVHVRLHYQWVILPREDRTVKKYFGEDMPYIGDIERNISILLLNRNPVFHRIMPIVPAIIELGSVKPANNPQPLSPELKKFLDNSANGVVYFSLGSNALSANLPDEVKEAFIQTFSHIPQNVVWKYENETLPGKPKNVFIQKWIPQAALLGHPNVKVFITQGGLQSMEETISNHVPIIGIPSHSDQTMNVDTAVKYGFGIEIDFNDLKFETLNNAIHEIVNNQSYKENIMKTDKLMKDLPLDGLKRAVWWIEYVIRHKGAKHLRSPSMDIPWYQYLLLDVIAVVSFVLFLFVYILHKLIKLSIRLVKKLFSTLWSKLFKSKKE